ncbi:hypothetical protein FPOAC2_12539 [Fusarium poae]|uniref:hypothetical protein n=1 Tax=Fusarium poae TaxID=36050 RepID=UPI001CE8CA1F|nr:hypothetical protein FPOAC1_012204 [Fusarium poae]KAG8667376.1 hypothetical protein FPOAC1_012204 [Fusarium poae]
MRFIEAPYLGQSSPSAENVLAKALKETEEKLKASENENERLSLRIKLLEERHEQDGKMMEFNYRLLSRLDCLRDDHENLKKTVTASNEKFENKFARYKSKASAQEKEITKIKESAVSLTEELSEKSAKSAATVRDLVEDVEFLNSWMSEVKVAEYELQTKEAEHELQAKKAERELQDKKIERELKFKRVERELQAQQSRLELLGQVSASPRSRRVETAWGDSTRDRRDEWYGEEDFPVATSDQLNTWGGGGW